MSLAATGGGLVFGGDVNGRFRAFDDRTGEVLWEINLGSSVSGFPITYGRSSEPRQQPVRVRVAGMIFAPVEQRNALRDRTETRRRRRNLGSSVSGFPITYAVDGRQYVAVSTGTPRFIDLTPELRPSLGNNLFVFALPE